MKTGILVRAERDNRFRSLDIGELTADELRKAFETADKTRVLSMLVAFATQVQRIEADRSVNLQKVAVHKEGGCDLCGDFPAELRAKCHPTAPLRVSCEEDGVLILRCFVPACNREVVRIMGAVL